MDLEGTTPIPGEELLNTPHGLVITEFGASRAPAAAEPGRRQSCCQWPLSSIHLLCPLHPARTSSSSFSPAHRSGELVNLIASADRQRALRLDVSPQLPTLTLTQRQLCDIELLMSGGFSPLNKFMTRDVYEGVVNDMRLGPSFGDRVFPMPITLDVSDEVAAGVSPGSQLALRDPFYNLVAVLTVEDKYQPNKAEEALKVFGTRDQSHPAVDYLMNQAGSWYIGGSVEGVRLPQHFDFNEDRLTPRMVRRLVASRRWDKFVAFQTRNPMHRAHIELTRLAAEEIDAGVLIHPVVGMTKPGDVDYAVRVRCYRAIVASGRYYKPGRVLLALLPLAMRMAGPREALWHAIIRKNHGATHFVVGRDHAGCKSSAGEDFYGAYDAQNLVKTHEKEIGITMLQFKKITYVPRLQKYLPENQVQEGEVTDSISGTQFRAMMASGEPIPAWFSDPDVIKILREVSPPKNKRGFAILFTGLSGGGKTTISHALIKRLQSVIPTRKMTILDGDVVRTHLSKELGFSVAHRNINVARMGFVASEVAKHGGIAICSSIAPFEKSREATKRLVQPTGGGYLLVHVSTSAEDCAARDVKGLYRKAMQSNMPLTGVSHPYENPENAQLTIDAGKVSVEDSVRFIVGWLVRQGYVDEELVSAGERGQDLEERGVLTEG